MAARIARFFSEPAPKLILALLLGLQLVFTLGSFRSGDDLVNDRPVLNVDFCSQYYWSYAARAFHARDGRLWGYDPFYMAGYPLDFVFNSSLPVQLAAVALRDFSLGRVIKGCFVVSFLLVPLVLYYSLRQFDLDPGPAVAGCGLGVVYFWVAENALFGRFGMIAGAFMLHFFMAPLGLLYRGLTRGEQWALVLLGLALPAAFLVHKTAFVLILPLAGFWIALFSRKLSARGWAMLAAVFLVTGLVNFHWLHPFFRFLPLKIEDPGTTFFQKPDLAAWFRDLKWLFAIPLLRLLILGTGLFGLRGLKKDRPELFQALAPGLVFFGALAYLGHLLPVLSHLQPYRYVSAFYYLMLPASGHGLMALHSRLKARPGLARYSPAGLAALLAVILLLPSFRLFSRVAPLRTDLDRPSAELVDWLRQETDRSARVLMEDINVWTDRPIYGGARLVGILPALEARELIGGPLPNAFIQHRHAGFHDGRFLDRPIAGFSDAELDAAMNLYNVGWVVCWSEESRARVGNYPAARRSKLFWELEVFTLERGHNFFLAGSGQVSSDFNRIELSGLVPESGRVVISYHWVEGLKSDPAAALERVMAGDDPVGFIGIQDPPPSLVIRLE